MFRSVIADQYEHEASERTKINLAELGTHLSGYGKAAVRFSIAGVLGWIGAMKFTAYEANAIEGLVASSPLYRVTG